jgi:hypothetical protein
MPAYQLIACRSGDWSNWASEILEKPLPFVLTPTMPQAENQSVGRVVLVRAGCLRKPEAVMSSKRKKLPRRTDVNPGRGAIKSTWARGVLFLAVAFAFSSGILAVGFALFVGTPARPTSVAVGPPHREAAHSARTLDDLLGLPVEELGTIDVAEMNLLCAVGLPGAEGLNVPHALSTLDQWASRVGAETTRHLYRVNDPRYAEHYRHSEAYLRAEMLVQVLCEDLGIRYNLGAKDDIKFTDSRVAFIHAMIPGSGQTVASTLGGTCASMPVLYVAVGRRLGYPLKLVTTKAHVFVRWDGMGHPNLAWRERFNMEGTNGFSSYPDEHYRTWPFKLTDQEVQANSYLLSLAPAEELAEFLAARGHCGFDNGQMAFAARCYENAYRYDSRRPLYGDWFLAAALRSGYRPVTPVLASMLAQRMGPAGAHRSSVEGMPLPSEMAAAAPRELPALSATRNVPWQYQVVAPALPQEPYYAPTLPQLGMPSSGVPTLPQPGIRGQSPR